MNINIQRANGLIAVDDVTRTVDLSAMDMAIDSVNFDTGTGFGKETRQDGLRYIGRSEFLNRYDGFFQAFKAAGGPPVRSLDAVKADAREQINSMRDNLEQSGFPYLNTVFDSDPVSVQRITIAAQAAQAALAVGQTLNINWTAQDNAIVALTAQEIIGMPVALATYGQGLHANATAKKALIDAAETIEDVAAIGWE